MTDPAGAQQRNLYSPPVSQVEMPSEVAPRPLSVWLWMLVFLAGTVVFGAGTLRSLWLIASHANELRDPLAAWVGVAWRVALIVAVLAVIVAVYRRRHWSLWLGVVGIIGLAILSLLSHDTTQYPNEAQKAGAALGQFLILPILFAWWTYAFGFSGKARRYFAKKPSSAT